MTMTMTMPASRELTVWWLDLLGAGAHLDHLCRYLPEHELVSAASRPEPARRQWVTCRAALRRLLGEHLGIAPRAVELRRAAAGKPEAWVGGAPAELRFSLSHSGEWAMIGLSGYGEIGVDVERPRRRPLYEHAAGMLAPAEKLLVDGMNPAQRERELLGLWTRKEGYLKAIGVGLRQDPSSVDALSRPGRVLVSDEVPPPSAERRSARDAGFDVIDVPGPEPGWAAAVVTEGRGWRWRVATATALLS
jgi:4'-phosphopantetheinyl transferase